MTKLQRRRNRQNIAYMVLLIAGVTAFGYLQYWLAVNGKPLIGF